MRLLPGEFSAQTQSLTSQLEKWANEHQTGDQMNNAHAVWAQAQALQARIESGLTLSEHMASESLSSKVRSVSALCSRLLQLLHKAGHSLGLWAYRDLIGDDTFELRVAHQEFTFRLADIKRNACWAESSLSPDDVEELDKLWLCLEGRELAVEAEQA